MLNPSFLADFNRQFHKKPTWEEFCVAIVARYGEGEHQERKTAAKALETIKMKPNEESIESFIDNFNVLRRRAGSALSNDSIFDLFGAALPMGIYYKVVTDALITLPEAEKNNFDFFASKVREHYNRFKTDYVKTTPSSNTQLSFSPAGGPPQSSSTHPKRPRAAAPSDNLIADDGDGGLLIAGRAPKMFRVSASATDKHARPKVWCDHHSFH